LNLAGDLNYLAVSFTVSDYYSSFVSVPKNT